MDAQDGIVRGWARKEPTPPHPILVGESTQKHSIGVHDTNDGDGNGLIEGAVHVHRQVVTSRQLAPPAV